MSLLSAVDAPGKSDISNHIPSVGVPTRTADGFKVVIRADSNIWKRKCHHYLFHEGRIDYWTELEGNSRVDRVYYFRGTWRSRELASVPGFTQVFSPQANFLEKQEFYVSEFTSIAAGNDERVINTVRGFALHGAPLCFVFHQGERGPFLAAGILCRPGEYSFHAFEFNHLSEEARNRANEPIVGTQAFSLAYHGHLKVKGTWVSPVLTMQFADERFSAVEHYLRLLEEYGGTFPRTRPYPEWTFRPVYCTWHDQVASGWKIFHGKNRNAPKGTRILDFYFGQCTQHNCKRWLSILEKNGIRPGTIIIDAGWQKRPGISLVDQKKFPDIRGFIDECHSRGMKVMLWIDAWNRGGVPDEECLTINGKPVAVDPSNSRYLARMGKFVRRLLSSDKGCYNADGLKVDGMTGTPGGPFLHTGEGISGFELARRLLDNLYREAVRAKEDAVIGQYTAFPYFADLCDFARTGDLYTVKGDPISTNTFRAWIQRTVMPDVAIDTDGALHFSYLLPVEEVFKAQKAAGVPCLYQAEYLMLSRDFCLEQVRRLSSREYKAIRRIIKSPSPGGLTRPTPNKPCTR
ncbi:MAG TPA: hypothetical protein PKX93_00385 [bacterium]|nr:hypothetical protein [bacterium]HOL65899.1 hypothetical protein [bacterium]HPP11299.1 hypothetical protein [bacterium]